MTDYYAEGCTVEGVPYAPVLLITTPLRWDSLEYAVEIQRKQPPHSYAVYDQTGQPLYGRHVPGTECEERTITLKKEWQEEAEQAREDAWRDAVARVSAAFNGMDPYESA